MKLNVLVWTLVSVLIASCKSDYDAPCRDQVVQITNDFTAAQDSVIPYGYSDSVVFVSTVGDTVLFQTVKYQESYHYLPTVVKGNPECPADWDAFKVQYTLLFDSVANMDLEGTWFGINDTCRYGVAGKSYITRMSDIGVNTGHYADSVILNQKVFYKVNTLYRTASDSIMVNAEFGVVYFVSGGKAYRLESFK